MPTTIVLFGGPTDERHASVASAQHIVRTLGTGTLAWFWAPDGFIYDVGLHELLAHQRPLETDFLPTRPAIFPDLEQALDTLPVENPLFILALHGSGDDDGAVQEALERRGIPSRRAAASTGA